MRWMSILIGAWPANAKETVSVNMDPIMSFCMRNGLHSSWLRFCDRLMDRQLHLAQDLEWPTACEPPKRAREWDETERRGFQENRFLNWYHHGLRNDFPMMVEPVLRWAIGCIESVHLLWQAWVQPEQTPNTYTYMSNSVRLDIESRMENESGLVNLLIDIVRDSLVWLAINTPASLRAWCMTLIQSEALLLRRLAVFGMSRYEDEDKDAQITWLLQHCSFYDRDAEREISNLVVVAFGAASCHARKRLLDELRCDTEVGRHSAQCIYSVRSHCVWLLKLQQVVPECEEIQHELNAIDQRENTEVVKDVMSELHSDEETHTGIWIRSPLTEEELLAKPAGEHLETLKTFKFRWVNMTDRTMLLRTVRNAIQRCLSWGWALAEEMRSSNDVPADLWTYVFTAWGCSKLELDEYENIFECISHSWTEQNSVDKNWQLAVCWILERLECDAFEHEEFVTLLPQAQTVVTRLSDCLEGVESGQDDFEWKTQSWNLGDRCIEWIEMVPNTPMGVLCHFWTLGLALKSRHPSAVSTDLCNESKVQVTSRLADSSNFREVAGFVFASRLWDLVSWESEWIHTHLFPLLWSPDTRMFRAAWVGMLANFPECPPAIPLLHKAFLCALPRINEELELEHREEFIEHLLNVFQHASSAVSKRMIFALFEFGDQDLRYLFGRKVTYCLRCWDVDARRHAWSCWLREYWQQRCRYDIPPPRFDADETQISFMWLPYLDFAIVESVDLVLQMPFQSGKGLVEALSLLLSPTMAHYWSDQWRPRIDKQMVRLLLAVARAIPSDPGWLSVGGELIGLLVESDNVPQCRKDELRGLADELGVSLAQGT